MAADGRRDDEAFLGRASDMVRTMRSRMGTLPPGIIVQAADGVLPEGLGGVVVYQLPTLLSQGDGMREAVEFARHRSMRLGSPRSAVFFETWTVPGDPDVVRKVEEIERRNGDPRTLPGLIGQVVVAVESDAGRAIRSLAIVRAPGEPDDLRPIPSRGRQRMPAGLEAIREFHLPSGRRDLRRVREWASRMDETHGAVELEIPQLAAGIGRFLQENRTGSIH